MPPDVNTSPLFSFVDSLSVIVTVVATADVVAEAAVPVKPASEILPLVNFFCALLESTTAKKSPSPSDVEVANSLKSTLTVTSPVVPDTSMAVPATTLVTLASVYPVPMLVPFQTPVATVPNIVIAVLDPMSRCTGAPLPSATTIFPSVSPTSSDRAHGGDLGLRGVYI